MDPKQKVCKICNKRYANGKALGGHMRSHLAKLPLPPKPKPKPNPNKPRSSCVSTTNSPNSSKELSHSQEFSVVEDMITDSEGEGEGEGESRQRHVLTTRRRSKRHRRSSETFTAEDAALFLVKLSKDRWDNKREVVGDINEELANKFKCGTCNKVFGSYQALGGHKANHTKMMKAEISDDDEDESSDEEEAGNEGGNNNYVDDEHHDRKRTFECQFCFKVFGSGQALGGHKKVHFSNNLPNRARISSRKFENRLIIDLNLPAVGDEEVE